MRKVRVTQVARICVALVMGYMFCEMRYRSKEVAILGTKREHGDEDHDDAVTVLERLSNLPKVPADAAQVQLVNGSICDETPHRCSGLDMGKRFSFLHVSKCAGTSWILELRELLPNLYPPKEAGMEYTASFQFQEYPQAYSMISIKSPRHHVWSLFSQCKYSGFGLETTSGTDFLRTGDTSESDMHDFQVWIEFFAELAPRPQTTCFNCYNPSNYQTQHLTSLLESERCSPPTINPDWEVAEKTLQDFDFVALTEFYHESKCLLFGRLAKGTSEKSTLNRNSVKDYLSYECKCPQDYKMEDIQYVHHDKGHLSSMSDLPPEVLATVDSLTKVDTYVYRIALRRFIREVAWAESETGLIGTRFLCDNKLMTTEPKLSYLGINVTQEYHNAKRTE